MQNVVDRLKVNAKMLNKTVKVLDLKKGEWVGEIVKVKDVDTFIVKGENCLEEVNIFDVRSLDD